MMTDVFKILKISTKFDLILHSFVRATDTANLQKDTVFTETVKTVT